MCPWFENARWKGEGRGKTCTISVGTEGFVLLRDGKEHFLLSCSILPSEISFPAGGEAHWAGRREPWSRQGMCCPCRAHPALGRFHPGHRDRTALQARVKPPSSSPALEALLRMELLGDSQGDTSQLFHSSSVQEQLPDWESAHSAPGQKEFGGAQAPQSLPWCGTASLAPQGWEQQSDHPDGASHVLQGARDVLYPWCS